MPHHLYAKALSKWGLDAQLDMLQEEAAELIMAVNKLRRSNYRKKSFVAEEIADTRMPREIASLLKPYRALELP